MAWLSKVHDAVVAHVAADVRRTVDAHAAAGALTVSDVVSVLHCAVNASRFLEADTANAKGISTRARLVACMTLCKEDCKP